MGLKLDFFFGLFLSLSHFRSTHVSHSAMLLITVLPTHSLRRREEKMENQTWNHTTQICQRELEIVYSRDLFCASCSIKRFSCCLEFIVLWQALQQWSPLFCYFVLCALLLTLFHSHRDLWSKENSKQK